MKTTCNLLFVLLVLFFVSSEALGQNIQSTDQSLNAGKVAWTERHIKTERVPFGVPVTREFWFKNVSKENLLLLRVQNTCSCMTIEWPRDPIAPGASGRITVTYDSQKEGDFYRLFTVNTNFDPNQSVPFALSGKVEKRLDASRN